MCIWLGLMAEIYNVKNIDLINFYFVTQSILMIVSCLNYLPLNYHWKYVYFLYKLNNINWINYKIHLCEFCLPYIYFSTGIVIICCFYFIAQLIIKTILFRIIKLIYLNNLFIIPYNLCEYFIYIIICLCPMIGILNQDFSYNIKKQLDTNIEIHHLIIGPLLINKKTLKRKNVING